LRFFSNNLLIFFFFFESTLIPTLFIIIGWGYKVERLNSGLSIFFYTLIGSFPILSIIFLIISKNNSLFFEFLEIENFLFITYLFFILAFLIKIPIFFIHSWLPKAHVEAPVAGSIILAGVLLKLGGYGIFRIRIIYKYFLNYNLIWIYIRIFGGVVRRLMCLRQKDIKALIAYSSVAHISLVILGLLIYSDRRIWGSFLVIVAHGLCSSGIFFMSNIIYERSQRRRIFFNKSLLTLSPSLGLLWFLFCGANISSPFSLNLVGEIFLIYSIIEWSYYLVFSLITLCFLGGVYNLYLFSITRQGPITLITNCFFSVNIREFLICIIHLIPLNILFLKIELFY
jgi:NADH-ubiquinone oxidoreductase chain 4